MLGGTLVQVTARSVRLVDSSDFSLITEFVAPNTITVASSTLSQVTLAISGGELLYLELNAQTRTFTVAASTQLDQDIACLSLRPVSGQTGGSMEVEGDAEGATRSSILAIAMWTDNTVRLHALPTLGEICRVQLGTDTQARDILLVELGGKAYLLVGLGDGRLITYSVDLSGDLPSLGNRRNGVLGTHPITFSCFHNAGSLCVFAASDRPTVIYSKNGKILFSVLDVSQVEFTSMAPFHSELFPNCLALGSESSLVIGVTEDIQKVHIQTVPLQQAPRRIVHSASSAVYAGKSSLFDFRCLFHLDLTTFPDSAPCHQCSRCGEDVPDSCG
jgi:DNA damage-binding protein 1